MKKWSLDKMLSDCQCLVHNGCYDYVSIVEGLEPNVLYF